MYRFCNLVSIIAHLDGFVKMFFNSRARAEFLATMVLPRKRFLLSVKILTKPSAESPYLSVEISFREMIFLWYLRSLETASRSFRPTTEMEG